jgi:hypothetical protein
MLLPRTSLAIAGFLIAPFATANDTGDQAHQQTVMKDLFAVITLDGQACEQVVDYDVIAPMNYLATCKNGKRYRIGVTPEGRVETAEHKD